MDLVPDSADVLVAEDEFDCDEDAPQALVTELRTIRMANTRRGPTRQRLASGLPCPIVAPISTQSVGEAGVGGHPTRMTSLTCDALWPARGNVTRARSPWLEPGFLTIEHMTIQRMDHVGIVVEDLAAATEFFVELGLVLQGEMAVEGRWVDRIVGLEGVRADIAMMQTPDGHGRLELVEFHSPSPQGGNRHAPANTPGLRHVAFAVEDIDDVVARLRAHGAELVGELERYEDSYRLCYVRGPEGIIVELAERIG
jgi:catechol 2,3-dioxygenase-like lactoylglutathione lyase family enzyme